MPETIGTAYIQVEPVAKGIQQSISQAISGGSSEYGNALSGAFSGAAKLAAGAVGAATTAIIGFGTSSVSAGKEFDSSMSQVAATMGITTGEIGELRDFAREMGATTAFSAKEAADALNYMALAGYDADTSMNMLPNVLNLAAAGDMELARASDMVTDAQTALGLSLDETGLMVDQMARASSKSNTSVEQLGDAFLEIGANARNLSGGTTELSTVLGVLADNGIKGTEAGTHLRNIMLSLTPSTDKAAAAWKQLGVEAYDTQGNLRPLPDVFNDLSDAMDGMTNEEKTNMLSAMFNKTDLASVNALLGTSADRYRELDQAISGAWYTTQSIDEVFKKHNTSLDDVKARLGELNISEAEFQQALDYCNGDAREFAEILLEDTDGAVSMSQVMTALGGNLNWVQSMFDETAGAAQAMADTQLDNLEGDITKFKSALGEAQIVVSDQLSPALRDFVQFGTEGLGKITEGFNKEGLSGAMDALGGVLSDGIKMITEKIPDAISAGMELLGAVGQGIIDNMPALVNAAVQVGVEFVKGVTDAVPQMAAGALMFIDSLGQTLSENSETIFQTGAQLLETLWNGITTALPQLTERAVDILTYLTDGIKTNLPQMLEIGLNALMEFSGSLRENLGLLVDAGIDMLMALAKGLIDSLPTMLKTIPTIVSNIAGIINDNAPKLLAAGIELIGQLAIGIVKAVPTLMEEFPKIIKAIWDVITAVNWINLGMHIVTFIGNGVTSLASRIPDLMKTIGQNAHDFVKNIDWLTLGKNVINFIVNGIKTLQTSIPNLIKTIGTNGFNMLKNIDWKGLGSTVINFIGNGIKSLMSNIPNLLKTIGTTAMTTFKSIDWLGLGFNVINGVAKGIADGAFRVVDALMDAARAAWDAVTDFFDTHSPSKKMAWLGDMLDRGLVEGINENSDMVNEAVQELGEDSIASFQITGARDTYTPTVAANSPTTVNMTIYAAAGQDVNELAEIIEERLQSAMIRGNKAYA